MKEKKLRPTQEMLRPLSRTYLEELTEQMGALLGTLLVDACCFLEDCEEDGRATDLEAQLPSYSALKASTDRTLDWLDD